MCKRPVDNLSEEEQNALVNLSKDKNIVISKADKGAAVVIQNTTEYKTKMLDILKTPGKFKQLDQNETKVRENKLQNYLRSLNTEVEKKK